MRIVKIILTQIMNNTLQNTSINILQNLLLQNESIKRQNTGSLFNITTRKNSSFGSAVDERTRTCRSGIFRDACTQLVILTVSTAIAVFKYSKNRAGYSAI